MDNQSSEKDKTRRRRCLIISIGVGVNVALAIGLGVGLGVVRRGGGDGGSPTMTISPAPTATFSPSASPTTLAFNQLFEQFLTVSSGKDLLDPLTPQNMALQWVFEQQQNENNIATTGNISTDTNATIPFVVEEDRIVQRYLLAVIYYTMNGQDWFDQVDFLTPTDECTWNLTRTDTFVPEFVGVTCDDNGVVVELILANNGLSGTIPTEVFAFPNLTSLSFALNNIVGTIPFELGLLTSVTDFYFFGNSITGAIPTSIMHLTNLVNFDAQLNKLAGTIPTVIGLLTKLDSWIINNNDLTGTLPTELGNLRELQRLVVDNNLLEGTVPTQLSTLERLNHIQLERNSLVGSVNGICDALGSTIDTFSADCREGLDLRSIEIECSCCTTCCADGVETCFSNPRTNG